MFDIGDKVKVRSECTALTMLPEVKGRVGEIVGFDTVYDFEVYFGPGAELFFDASELEAAE